MVHFFKGKKSQKATDNELINQLTRFNDNFKQRVNAQSDDTQSTNCCVSLFSCIKSTSAKIPQEYKDIASWLTTLAVTEAKGNVNEEVLVSALYASLSYVSQDAVGSEVPAQILKTLIEEIGKQFNLDLTIEPDYVALQNYCTEHKITIPAAINTIIANNQTSNAQMAKAV
ncbi:hypothetical protein Lsan_4134 [Legionella santicrucis]|uniref:Uncharacterized protein n=1 Tax=Legionella santicrucis TaxID=45074 RepID=A0A0W0Y9U9_9GAMM|nr:hypothetical protein [Legionella santicrucis]KTD53724.1 hypothetical protein Lsan_4134 [Legionella santicrucis]